MKKILFLLLFCNVTFAQEKVNEAIYSFGLILENVSDLRKIAGKELNNFAEVAELSVLFNTNYSYYRLKQKENSQDMFNPDFATTPVMLSADTPILYDKKNNLFIYSNYLFVDKEISDSNVYEWDFKDETKEIDGFLCYKALGKSKELYEEGTFNTVEVWYCPEMPYAYGPNKVQGLPGLVVLAVINNEIFYKLEGVAFDVKQELPLDKLKEKKMSIFEFHKARNEIFGE